MLGGLLITVVGKDGFGGSIILVFKTKAKREVNAIVVERHNLFVYLFSQLSNATIYLYMLDYP